MDEDAWNHASDAMRAEVTRLSADLAQAREERDAARRDYRDASELVHLACDERNHLAARLSAIEAAWALVDWDDGSARAAVEAVLDGSATPSYQMVRAALELARAYIHADDTWGDREAEANARRRLRAAEAAYRRTLTPPTEED